MFCCFAFALPLFWRHRLSIETLGTTWKAPRSWAALLAKDLQEQSSLSLRMQLGTEQKPPHLLELPRIVIAFSQEPLNAFQSLRRCQPIHCWYEYEFLGCVTPEGMLTQIYMLGGFSDHCTLL